jgi:hypothetical protein
MDAPGYFLFPKLLLGVASPLELFDHARESVDDMFAVLANTKNARIHRCAHYGGHGEQGGRARMRGFSGVSSSD